MKVAAFFVIVWELGSPQAVRSFVLQPFTTSKHRNSILQSSTDQSANTAEAIHKEDKGVESLSENPKPVPDNESSSKSRFNLQTALFCAGLAFDAYVEPAEDSSRWERGSQGMKVAFVSESFTRNIYKGLVSIKPKRMYELPDDDDGTESIMTGGGVDAYLLVAAVEGQWKEDIDLLEQAAYHDGVLGLVGAAHVGRSRTAWANVNENQSKAAKKKEGEAKPYHIPSSWGKGGQAIMTDDEPPFYIYVQDPSSARLVFTVMDDDVVGDGSPIGSAHRRLSELIPMAGWSGKKILDSLKKAAVDKLRSGEIQDVDKITFDSLDVSKEWEGEIKLTSKPRIKDKTGQRALGMAAGAMLAGPVGAAAGAVLGSVYEGQVKGRIELQIGYLPFPTAQVPRRVYTVTGGTEGINWGDLYRRSLEKQRQQDEHLIDNELSSADLEHCFFINHEKTGATCAVYRSLKQKLIVVSFRGTCEPIDLVTDASIAQDAWIEGEDVSKVDVMKVHSGFRKSMNSISRRLKELILGVPGEGETISQYDMITTGHSLGAALATLFTMDIAEYGIDAGRGLPQEKPSDNWFLSITSSLMGNNAMKATQPPPPPRPKSLKMYNMGSPRVGNSEFADRFDQLIQSGNLDEAYRIVSGEDIVARNPRSINALALGNIQYEHCGPTVLVSLESTEDLDENGNAVINPKIWIEGESDDSKCPVRDGTPLTSPLADGSLLADLSTAAKETFGDKEEKSSADWMDYTKSIGALASKFGDRLKTISATDITSVVGIDRVFAEREARIIQSILRGDALAHHMENEYYAAMARAAGFVAKVGEEIRDS